MSGDEKKKRDPIFAVCFVVFILAAVSVFGVYINEHYLVEDNTLVAYGDDVTVNYIGTFYDFNGNEHAMEFDSGKINFSADTNSNVLQKFWEACVGHKVRDRIEVIIDPEDGYVAPITGQQNISVSGMTMSILETMFQMQFESIYDYNLSNGMTYIQTVYGWDALAILDSTTQMITLIHMPVAGMTYTYIYDDGDNDSEESSVTVTFAVTSVDGETITFDVGFEGYKSTGNEDEVEMIELQLGDETWQVTEIGDSTFSYKTSSNTNNQTLYFVIEILEIN